MSTACVMRTTNQSATMVTAGSARWGYRMHVHSGSVYQEVVGSSDSLNTRADELLHALEEQVHSSASAICLWNPLTRSHTTLANHCYPAEVMSHFNSWFVANDPLFKQMERTRSGALRWQDFPDYRQSYSVTEIFTRAGFDEGLSARLVTANGFYAGTLHVNSDNRRCPSDSDVAEINRLRFSVASLLEVTTRPGLVADFLAPGQPAWLIDRTGNYRVLRDDICQPETLDSDLLAAVAPIAGSERQFRWCDANGKWHLVRALPATPRHDSAVPTALVIAAPQPLPFGLTGRELEIVTLVAKGMTTQNISQTLSISPKTVGHHIEHALSKTNSPNRVALASLANQFGLLSSQHLS